MNNEPNINNKDIIIITSTIIIILSLLQLLLFYYNYYYHYGYKCKYHQYHHVSVFVVLTKIDVCA